MSDLAAISASLERLLRLRAIPFGMKLFADAAEWLWQQRTALPAAGRRFVVLPRGAARRGGGARVLGHGLRGPRRLRRRIPEHR